MVNNRTGQAFLHQGKFTLFPDTHSEAYFGIMATYVQEIGLLSPLSEHFPGKNMHALFEDNKERSFHYLNNDFFMRTSTNILLLLA